MATFSADEIERAFIRYWRCGAVGEDWDGWADCFTEDALYVEHVLGSRHGRWGGGPEWTRGGRSYAERRPIDDAPPFP